MRLAVDYYDILGIPPTAGFTELRKAYYRRAKECHPDRFGGDPAKEEEFKRLVEAFGVLSDPTTRLQHDQARTRAWSPRPDPIEAYVFAGDGGDSVMDSQADDTLEELIVGNSVPCGATLQTLMRDLESTERFCLFREAKTRFCSGQMSRANRLLQQAVSWSPGNILYRVYLGWTFEHLGETALALEQLHIALQLGAARRPPQRLMRVRRELQAILAARGGLLARLDRHRHASFIAADEAEDERLRRLLGRALRHLDRSSRPDRPRLTGHSPNTPTGNTHNVSTGEEPAGV